MALDNRHPTGDTGIGAVIVTRRIRTVQYLVADLAAAETYITAEWTVDEKAMVQKTTPPHQDRQKTRSGGQNGREGGRTV